LSVSCLSLHCWIICLLRSQGSLRKRILALLEVGGYHPVGFIGEEHPQWLEEFGFGIAARQVHQPQNHASSHTGGQSDSDRNRENGSLIPSLGAWVGVQEADRLTEYAIVLRFNDRCRDDACHASQYTGYTMEIVHSFIYLMRGVSALHLK